MFCERCGTQLPEEAGFCTNCGARVAEIRKPQQRIQDTSIQLRVKPAFKFGYKVLLPLIAYVSMLLIMVLVFSMVSSGMGVENTIGKQVGGILLGIGTVIFAIVLAIKTAINKKQYDCYVYDFYKTKVIFKDSFINLSEKEVQYRYIREVTMRQTFFQRFFNIGNIILFTNAEVGYGNGIFIMNVEKVQDVYREIKSIIDV